MVARPLHSIICSFFIITIVPSFYCQDDKGNYEECKKPYDCGFLQSLSYPFWGSGRPRACGHEGFELECQEGQHPVLRNNGTAFRVVGLTQSSKRMTLALLDYREGLCPPNLANTTFNMTFFISDPRENEILNLAYDCQWTQNERPPNENIFSCPTGGDGFFHQSSDNRLRDMALDRCRERVEVPVRREAIGGLRGTEGLGWVLIRGFDVSYKYEESASICKGCEGSEGVCGTNINNSGFACHCRDQSYPHVCLHGTSVTYKGKLAIGIGSAGSAAILTLCIIIIIHNIRGKDSSIASEFFRGNVNTNNQDIEGLFKRQSPLALRRYSFSDVRKMTCFFKDKLGQGGFGVVYKGKLPDDRLVAVKVLNASKSNGEEFINEVASISRTSHVNVVTLLGFCLEGSKRVLIYDFMPNGSLEKFINKQNGLKADGQLGSEKLYQIAIGVSRGLEYLHRGCNTRIVHFDIKPNNILLDQEFCPKIADFGLAKLCTTKESILSMSMARGTIGYMAPEVFSRNFGEVSHKSDVYSYGMLVLEMVGGRQNVVEPDHTSEQYFPQWIYRHLELGTELELQGVKATEESDIVRKLIITGLWCIQINPFDRPSIGKVIEMLEGPVEALKIPPKPFLFSPPRLPLYSSTASLP